MRYGVVRFDLTPLEADTFRARFPDGELAEFEFTPWEEGRPRVLDWGGRIFDRQ